MTIDQHLEAAIDWAEERLRSGAEPPWTYYRLMQLKESCLELRAGMDASVKTDCSQRLEQREEPSPPQGASIHRIDVARRHSNTDDLVMPT